MPLVRYSMFSSPSYLNLSQQLSADLLSSLLIMVHFLPFFSTKLLSLSISYSVHFPFRFRLLKFRFRYLQQLSGDLLGKAVDKRENIFCFLEILSDLSPSVKSCSNYSREISLTTKNLPTAQDNVRYSYLSNFPFLWFQIVSFHFFYS